MRVLYLVLIACVCLASAKYLPYEREERDLHRHHQRQIRDLSDASASNSIDEDSSDSDSTEKTLQEQLEEEKIKQECKQEKKRLKEECKRQEKIEKEERKRLERLEKERRKQEEKERKHQERLQKEERKREEKIKKELQKLAKENTDESDETEDSQDLEDIWDNFIFEKYGLTDASSDLAKDAAVHTYLHEKYGLSPQSSDSEFRQAIVKSINESIGTNSTQEDEFKSYLVREVNVTGIQALIKDNEREIAELKNESALLDNISLPWVAVAKQEIEEKNALLESVSKFLTHLLPNQTTSSDQKTLNSPSESEASLTEQSLGNNNSNLGSQISGNEDSSVSGTTSTGTEVPMSVNLLSETTINYEAKISGPTLATGSETEGSGDSSTSAGTPNAVEEAELNNLAISSASAPDSNLNVNSETGTSGSTLVLASRIQGSGDSSTITVTPNNAEDAGLNTLSSSTSAGTPNAVEEAQLNNLAISSASAPDGNLNVNSETGTSGSTLVLASRIQGPGDSSTITVALNNAEDAGLNTLSNSTSAGTPNAVEEAKLNNLAISSASTPDSNLNVNSETGTSDSTLVLASRIQGSSDSSTITVAPNNAEDAGLNTLSNSTSAGTPNAVEEAELNNLAISSASTPDSNLNVNSETGTSDSTLVLASRIQGSSDSSTITVTPNNGEDAGLNTLSSSTSAGTPNAVEEAELNNLAISSASAPDSNLNVNSETGASGSTLVLASRIQGPGISSTITVAPNNAEDAGLNTLSNSTSAGTPNAVEEAELNNLAISSASTPDSNLNVNSETGTSGSTLVLASRIQGSGDSSTIAVTPNNAEDAGLNTLSISYVSATDSNSNINSETETIVTTLAPTSGIENSGSTLSGIVNNANSTIVTENTPITEVLTSESRDNFNVVTSEVSLLSGIGSTHSETTSSSPTSVVATSISSRAVNQIDITQPADEVVSIAINDSSSVAISRNSTASPAQSVVTSSENVVTSTDEPLTSSGNNVATTAVLIEENVALPATTAAISGNPASIPANNEAPLGRANILLENVTSPADTTVFSAFVNNAATPEVNTATTDDNVATTANSEVGITLSDNLTTNSAITSNNAAATTEGIPVDNSVAVVDTTVIDATVVPKSVQELSILNDFSATLAPSEIISTLSTNAEPLPSSPTSLDVSVPSQTSVVDSNLGIQSTVANTDAPVTILVTDSTATIAPMVTDLPLVNTIAPIAPEVLVVVTDVPVVDAQPQAASTVQESQFTVGPNEVIPPITVPSEPGAAIVDMELQ